MRWNVKEMRLYRREVREEEMGSHESEISWYVKDDEKLMQEVRRDKIKVKGEVRLDEMTRE